LIGNIKLKGMDFNFKNWCLFI